MEVLDAANDLQGAQSYKYIYDTSTITIHKSIKIGQFSKNVKFVFLWILIPITIGGIIFALSICYCKKRVERFLPS